VLPEQTLGFDQGQSPGQQVILVAVSRLPLLQSLPKTGPLAQKVTVVPHPRAHPLPDAKKRLMRNHHRRVSHGIPTAREQPRFKKRIHEPLGAGQACQLLILRHLASRDLS
jgi:hypothetical protein